MPALRFSKPACVFLRIPKTGTTSILKGLLGGKENAAEIYRSSRIPEEWRHLFTFAMVRNPFTRFFSAYKMFEKKNFQREPLYGMSFLTPELSLRVVNDHTIPLEGKGLHSRLRMHVLPMTHPYLGLNQANYIGRFEEFEAEWYKLCGLLKTGTQPVRMDRQSEQVGYGNFYTPSLRQAVEKVYAQDLDEFGYTFSFPGAL